MNGDLDGPNHSLAVIDRYWDRFAKIERYWDYDKHPDHHGIYAEPKLA
jgi:hypothetical protein